MHAGADIEIIGLLKSAVRWLAELYERGAFRHAGVVLADGSLLEYAAWNALLQHSFEQHFWIPVDAADDHKYQIAPALVNRRGIYKVSKLLMCQTDLVRTRSGLRWPGATTSCAQTCAWR